MRWRRHRDDQGAVALEAALVTPILLVLVLGIIEFSFAMRNYVVVVSDSRVGARIAATAAGAGWIDCQEPVAGDPIPDMPCVPQEVPAVAQIATRAIQTSGSAMPMDNINYILIYRADSTGYPDGGNNDFSTCPTGSCVKFRWAKNAQEFVYSSGSWRSASISACFPGKPSDASGKKRNLERVGVYVNATHHAITGLFFDELDLTDHAVMNFEPLAASMCGEDQHS